MARRVHPWLRRRATWALLAGVVSLVVTGVVVWRVVSSNDQAADTDVMPPPSGMVVDLHRVADGNGPVASGTVVALSVSAAGQAPLAAVELWADDVLVERTALDGRTTATRLSFEWTATTGEALLTARSVDSAGRTALSNAVRVRAADEPLTSVATVVEHPVAPGDTLESIAATYGTPAAAIVAANPGGFGADLAPLVTSVVVPVTVTAADAGVTLPAASGASGLVHRPRTLGPPAGVQVQGCDAVVNPPSAPTATGVAAYVLPPDGSTFTLVAAGPSGRPLHVPLPSGRSYLVIAPFDGSAQWFGDVGAVEPGTGCAAAWTGEVRLDGSFLVAPGVADAAYLYLSDGDGWTRVPETGTVPRTSRGFDFRGVLPDLGTGPAQLEAWGRSGGQLVFLGKGELTAAAAATPTAPAQIRTQLLWITSPGSAGAPEIVSTGGFAPDPGILRFRWKASTPMVTSAVWQVLAYLPSATSGVDVPGVIAQDVVSGSEGVFPIDFAAFAGTPVVSVPAGASLPLLAQQGGKVTAPASPGTEAVASVGAGGVVLAGQGAPSAQPVSALPPLPKPTRFYVRMVPFIGEQFVGRASPSVVIDTQIEIDPSLWEQGPIGEPGSDVYDLAVEVTPPSAPSPWLARCWRITKIDMTKADPQFSYLYPWFKYLKDTQYGGVVCPLCYVSGGGSIDFSGYYGYHCASDDSFSFTDPSTWANFPILGPLLSGLITLGASVWDFAVQLATYLKSKVVELVSLVGCQSFVHVASGGSSPPEAAQWCNTIAEIAVDAALISAGIPPTLPTFEQAMLAAKGQLVDLIVQQASALGIPCDEADLVGQATGDTTLTCEGLVNALLDKVIDAAEVAVTASAQSISGIFFPPGVYAIPHEKGIVQPPQVKLTVSPTASSPIGGLGCEATVMMASTYVPPKAFGNLAKMPDLNMGYDTNLGLTNGLWMVSQPYGGLAVEPTTVQLPNLKVGSGGSLSPASQSYVLAQLTPHDDIDAWSYLFSGQQHALAIPYSSVQFHPGATVITLVHSDCAKDITVIGTILPNRQLQVTKVIT